MDKMVNSAKFFYTGTKVARGIMNAAAWICGVVAVLVWFLPESAFFNGTETLTFGPVEIMLCPDGMLAPVWVRSKLSGMLAVCTLVFVFACKVLRVMQQILEPVQQGRPFGDDMAANIQKLAWLTLIGGGIAEIGKLAVIALSLGNRDLMGYFNASVVQSVRIRYELDLWFVVLFIFLMLMRHIFTYGQQLQQLSDETL